MRHLLICSLHGIIYPAMPMVTQQEKRPIGSHDRPVRRCNHLLAITAQGLDAFGAEHLPHSSVTIHHGHPLDVGFELSFGPHIRVADIVPKLGRLAATFALGHGYYPLSQNRNLKATGARSPRQEFTTTRVIPQVLRGSYVE